MSNPTNNCQQAVNEEAVNRWEQHLRGLKDSSFLKIKGRTAIRQVVKDNSRKTIFYLYHITCDENGVSKVEEMNTSFNREEATTKMWEWCSLYTK